MRDIPSIHKEPSSDVDKGLVFWRYRPGPIRAGCRFML